MEGQVEDLATYWLNERHALEAAYKSTVTKFPDVDAVLNQVCNLLGNIASLTRATPAWVVASVNWQKVVNSVKEDRVNLCRAFEGKTLYSALYGTYTVTLHEVKALAKSSADKPTSSSTAGPATSTTATPVPSDIDGFREQRRRKRTSPGGKEPQKKRATPPMSVEGKPATKAPITRNYFAPLGAADMDIPEPEEADTQDQQQTPATAGRPPSIVLTASMNLMHLQKEIKGLVKGSFEFGSTRKGTRVVTEKWPTILPFGRILMGGISIVTHSTQNLKSQSRP
jgi:hypothetical protein